MVFSVSENTMAIHEPIVAFVKSTQVNVAESYFSCRGTFLSSPVVPTSIHNGVPELFGYLLE